jgi:hypothetical protein
MAGNADPSVTRDRVRLSIATGLMAWVDAQCQPGGLFSGQGHATELALCRLRDEQEFIQDSCQRLKLPYNAAAFWQAYSDAVEAAIPNRPRRPTHDEKDSVVDRTRVYVSVERRLLKWVDGNCKPEGPFENPSHAIETALSHLRNLQPPAEAVTGVGFAFDGTALWKRYQKNLEATSQAGRKGKSV